MRNLCALIILLCFACKSKDSNIITEVSSISESIGKYVAEYSAKTISVDDDIIIRLSGAVIDQSEVGEKIGEDVFAISPKIEGEAYWKDMSTLVFNPSIPLQYDSEYTGTLKLGSLFEDVPTNIQKVNFPFHTRPLSYVIFIHDINYDPIKGNQISLTGTVKSSDYALPDEVKNLLSVFQKENKEVQINWTHSNSNTHHSFEVTGIQRTETPSELNLTWKDSKYNSGFSGKKSIVIYPEGEFEVVSANVAKGNTRKISLSFTDLLQKAQELDGLIKIKGYNGSFKYDISGSLVHIYPQNKITSPFTLEVNNAIHNSDGEKLKSSYSRELSFDPIKPAVRLAGKGVIVPHNDEIIFPFEAINLKGARIEILKIFSDNVLQFLQYNRLNTTYGLEPVGRIVHQEHIKLTDINTDKNDATYVRYALDLSNMIQPDPGAIYQVRLGFSKNDVGVYDCEETEPKATLVSQRDGFTSIMNTSNNYNWSDRNNPCKSSYYNSSRFVSRNVLASNIGIISKRNKENKIHLVLSDLRSIDPISDANVTFYDFQKQEILSTTSASDGTLTIELGVRPSFAIVSHDGDFGYINLQDHYANSLSEFDVSGKSKKKGLDGYIYGERGVWRPGDTLHLNFVLEDKEKTLPTNHPVTLEVKDAKGKEKYKRTITYHQGQIFSFPVATNAEDPTGNWTARVKVGGTYFQKTLKVETVKPNRLKIQYNIDDSQSLSLYKNQSIPLQSRWLHGAPANGLKAKVDMQIQAVATQFKGYSGYTFDDPARKVEPLPFTIFENILDSDGNALISIPQKKEWMAPGKLRANFKTKVFEKGGNFSEDNFSMEADLYASYVGIQIPKSRWGSKFIKQNTPTDIPIVVLDSKGKNYSRKKPIDWYI